MLRHVMRQLATSERQLAASSLGWGTESLEACIRGICEVVAVFVAVLQCAAVEASILELVKLVQYLLRRVAVEVCILGTRKDVAMYVAVYCSVLQCVAVEACIRSTREVVAVFAVCCSVLQCVAV